MNVAVWVMSGRFLVSEAPQVVQRQRVVPAVVVPFLFIVPVQMGHRGRFVGMVLANSVVLAQLCVGVGICWFLVWNMLAGLIISGFVLLGV